MEDKIENKIGNIDNIIIFGNLFFFFFLMWGIINNIHYSNDDYAFLYQQKECAKDIIAMSSRGFIGIVYYILSKIGINVTKYQKIIGCLMMLIFSICTSKITFIINKRAEIESKFGKIMVNFGSVFLFGNVFVAEWLWYANAYLQWGFAVGLVTISIILVLNKHEVLSFICLFCAVGSYQLIVAYYIIIMLLLAVVDSKQEIHKKTIFNGLKICFLGAMSILANMIFAKIIIFLFKLNATSRVTLEFGNIKQILKQYIFLQKTVWIDGFGLLPKGSMALALIVFLCFIVYAVEKKKRLFVFGVILLIGCGIFALIGCVQVLQGYCYGAVRVFVPYFSIYSVMIWLFALNNNIKNLNYKKVFSLIIVVFILINMSEMNKEALDIAKTNALDKTYIMNIEEKIQEYEEKYGEKIRKIGFCNDSSVTYKYVEELSNPNIGGEIGAKAFIQGWSDVYSIQYYTGRKLIKVEIPMNIKEKCSKYNWNRENLDHQLIFTGDTLYIIVY